MIFPFAGVFSFQYPRHVDASHVFSLLETQKAGKIVPLKKRVDDLKTISANHLEILADGIGNKHVLQGFPFTRDFVNRK